MTYPTPCCIKDCVVYVNLGKPLPSNMRFVCPGCEDAIFHSIMDRLIAQGYATKDSAQEWRRIIGHWRREGRKVDVPLGVTI